MVFYHSAYLLCVHYASLSCVWFLLSTIAVKLESSNVSLSTALVQPGRKPIFLLQAFPRSSGPVMCLPFLKFLNVIKVEYISGLFNHSLPAGQLDYFQVLTIENKAAKNICEQVLHKHEFYEFYIGINAQEHSCSECLVL